jgi:cyclase
MNIMRRGEKNVGQVLLTSTDGDGTLNGYDLALTRSVAETVPVPVIASGGAGKPEHFTQALTEGKADAALAAPLFHDRVLSIGEVKAYPAEQGIPVKLTEARYGE